MFNLQEFLNTAECTIGNLEVLLQNGIKTVKLFDEYDDCFGENTIDIEKALADFEETGEFTSIDGEQDYWAEEDIKVGNNGYNVFFTAEEAEAWVKDYTADWE